MRFSRWPTAMVAALIIGVATPSAWCQTRIMPLGDSITQGGQNHASYRYPLWFDLIGAGHDVEFVGSRNFINGGAIPNPGAYPNYITTFDRDHEGYWGWRTDQIEGIIAGAVTAAQPDIVLVHLGTNDIGQMGAGGVVNADSTLSIIIDSIRSVTPEVTLLLATVIPIGPGTGYFANADQVDSLNAVIATIVTAKTTAQSPIILVDQHTGFDLGTMMQADGLHPNIAGEFQMASVWRDSLNAVLPPLLPLTVSITDPLPGAVFTAPAVITLQADAQPEPTVTEVRFYADGQFVGADSLPPFATVWSAVPEGSYLLTAEAENDSGTVQLSNPVSITVDPGGGVTSIAIANPSFEDPVLTDGATANGPGVIGNWTFAGTIDTYTGIFNPPSGSYPTAGGSGTPTGADGINAAYLFNNGGPSDSVSATQVLGETLLSGQIYTLTVAVGKFLPGQPYVPSTYGGYCIELLAGTTVIASSKDVVDPAFGEFTDAFASVASDTVSLALLGQPLSIRLDLSTTDIARSTHFDHIRLVRQFAAPAGIPKLPTPPLRAGPNPFGARTWIAFEEPAPAHGRELRIVDVTGRTVRSWMLTPGAPGVWWDGATDQGIHAPAGIYFAIDSRTHRSGARGPGAAALRLVLLR